MRTITQGMLLLLLVVAATWSTGQASSPVRAEAACRFVLGFATLRDLVGADKVGACLEDEHFNLENGNSEQHTSGGLMVWRKVDNFTAFTDGGTSWINGPYGLQSRPNSERFSWEKDPVQPTAAAASPRVTASPAPTSPKPSAASPVNAGPRFDPAAFLCTNTPPVAVESTIPANWQVSAPRGWPGPVHPGDSVQVGLRDKFGKPGHTLPVTAAVIRPDGSSSSADVTLSADNWAYRNYPSDFRGARPGAAGTYTVTWQASPGFIACDGFVVAP